jgi:uncharacterized membrane-anchored protein YhcB (DUF1043 family)
LKLYSRDFQKKSGVKLPINTGYGLQNRAKKGKEEMETNLEQVKNLTIQLTEHTDQLEKHFENLSDQIHLQNDQLTKSYSKLKIEMIGKSER